MRIAPTPGIIDRLYLVAPPFSRRPSPVEPAIVYGVEAREVYLPDIARCVSMAGSPATMVAMPGAEAGSVWTTI
jgi:hypothetical protein